MNGETSVAEVFNCSLWFRRSSHAHSLNLNIIEAGNKPAPTRLHFLIDFVVYKMLIIKFPANLVENFGKNTG